MASLLEKTTSPHNGAPIIAAISYGSSNRKTGHVDTLWILPDDTAPHEAVKTGEDSAVCGDCPHRRGHGKLADCYVLPFQAALSVWKSAKAKPETHRPRARILRLGGYGDPAMLPQATVATLAKDYDTALGYSHQWRHGYAQWAKDYCMASADSLDEKAEANAKGWRTFRVTYSDDLQPDEIWCPATTNDSVTCERCGLCQGNNRPAKNIAVKAHGQKSAKLMQV